MRLAEPRSISLPLIAIGGCCCHEDRPSGRWPAIYCCWAFLVRTRDGIAPMAAQFSDGRLRRRRGSRRYRPCLVRMAVSARAHLGSRRASTALAWISRHMTARKSRTHRRPRQIGANGGAGAAARAQFWAAQTRVAAGGTAWPSDCWPDRAVRQATMVARTGKSILLVAATFGTIVRWLRTCAGALNGALAGLGPGAVRTPLSSRLVTRPLYYWRVRQEV